jgi:hypothetical protein
MFSVNFGAIEVVPDTNVSLRHALSEFNYDPLFCKFCFATLRYITVQS